MEGEPGVQASEEQEAEEGKVEKPSAKEFNGKLMQSSANDIRKNSSYSKKGGLVFTDRKFSSWVEALKGKLFLTILSNTLIHVRMKRMFLLN